MSKVKRECGSLAELRRWYDDYFSRHPAWPTSAAYVATIQAMLFGSAPPRGRLLDLACGGGHFLSRLPPAVQGTGLDFSAMALAQARERTALPLVQAPAEQLPFRDSVFDFLVCLGSFEHFMDEERGLEEMDRVTTTDARTLILVPNHPDWLKYDVQPVETVRSSEEWHEWFTERDCRVEHVAETDNIPELAESSAHCVVLVLRK